MEKSWNHLNPHPSSKKLELQTNSNSNNWNNSNFDCFFSIDGFPNLFLEPYYSYLSNRKQFVVVDGCKSNIKDVLAGVPQGSRLGPLLWILYVNDIIEDLESEVLLFADDTCIFATADDPAETAEIINRDLERIHRWANKWKVSFNPSKSKDIIFSNKNLSNSLSIIFDGTFVSRVHESSSKTDTTIDTKMHAGN